MRTLVWTRSIEDWQDDRDLFANASNILHLPCVRHQDLALGPLGASASYYVFTSPRAAEIACANGELLQLLSRAKSIYTFGPQTAATLRKHQLPVHLAEECRTAEALAKYLVAHLPRTARVTVAAAKVPAFNILPLLIQAGLKAANLILYETIAEASNPQGEPLSEADRLRLSKSLAASIICFASPSALRGFAQTFGSLITKKSPSLTAVTIGPTTGELCKPHFSDLVVCTQNSIADLAQTGLALAAKRQGDGPNNPTAFGRIKLEVDPSRKT